jgi:tetratricopeptide (TPR) repeat protein
MEREFQAAMAAEDTGYVVRAESLLLDLHKKQPGNFAVNESLGLLYVAGEKFAEALPLLEAAARKSDRSDIAHANLGAAYFKLHRNRDALHEFERAAQLNGKNAMTQQALGQLWMETNQPERAAEAFGAALELLPGDSNLLLNRAQALVAAGKSSQAKEILSKLPGADQSAAAESLLGDIDEKSGAYQQAAQHYARAVELDPSEADVWMLGLEFLRHWTFDAAIREFEAAAPMFPQSARMRLGLGVAYFGYGTYDKAAPVFADLLDADSGNRLYAELLGMSCTALMQESQHRCAVLLTYAQSHPRDARVSTYAATMLLQGTSTEERMHLAQRLLESALTVDPKLADAQYEMGVLKQNQSDWRGSIPNLEAAVALKPDFAKAHYKLALAYWRSGRKQEGQAQMDLQNKFSQQQEDDLNQRMRQVTTFLVEIHN